MFNERRTNFVAISSGLEHRHYTVYDAITRACQSRGITVFPIVGAKNIWVRDYLPVQANGVFTKFRYGYGSDNPQFESLKVASADWHWLSDVRRSRIRLDGGNVIRHGERAILTDMIFRHNPEYPKSRLIARLEKLLVSEVTIVPSEPGDDIGHADGICHFVPQSGRLLVHDYSRAGTAAYRRYHDRLLRALRDFDVVDFTYAGQKCPRITEKQFRSAHPGADTFNPGFGYYVNLLVVGDIVFVPRFGIPEDDRAFMICRREFIGSTVFSVECARLSMEGGLINCVTMNYEM